MSNLNHDSFNYRGQVFSAYRANGVTEATIEAYLGNPNNLNVFNSFIHMSHIAGVSAAEFAARMPNFFSK